ncbi:MAG TPA: hypothetical protein VK717_09360 [Opitutaceae bacterium]|nr:hypothetical protein [Opitutaceae bacterium]
MTSLDNPQLETLLREQAGPPLPDGGFSARVLAAIPPRRKARLGFRSWLIAASALGGFAFAWIRSAGSLDWTALGDQFDMVSKTLPAVPGEPVAIVALLITALWFLPTFITEETFE